MALFISTSFAAEVAITIDDFNVKSPEGDQKILNALDKHKVQATLFVTCKYLENPMVKERLSHWEKAGHSIANHTYSHWFYDGKSFPAFSQDVKKCHDMIKSSTNFAPLFRFPFLKGGKTAEQRNAIQNFLKQLGHKNGYVTIDASDWFVSQKLEEALKKKSENRSQALSGLLSEAHVGALGLLR